MRQAKIVCTLGPVTQSSRALQSLIEHGMNVARLNFSHGDHQTHGSVVKRIRNLEKRTGRHVAILQDLQGIKIRVGSLKGGKVLLQKGQPVEIRTGADQGTGERIYIDYPWLIDDARPGDTILLDDGLISLKVEDKKEGAINAAVVEGGILKEHKGVNLPGMSVSGPFFTRKDQDDLEFGIRMGVDFTALSFVRSARDILEVKTWLKEKGAELPLIAKIEKKEAIDNIDEILELVDGIMVARGDLGVEMPLEEVPVFQKMLITKANQARKVVITATQMLESMTQHSRPTRAEATDVANAVLDGTDALMLSAETSAGKYPFESVAVMDRVISFTETHLMDGNENHSVDRNRLYFPEAIAEAASRAAGELSAKCILAFTMTGLTARLISKFRPSVPIIAVSPNGPVVRRMSLYRGVVPFQVKKSRSTDRMIEAVDQFVLERQFAEAGDVVVLVAGHPIAARSETNFLKLHRVGDL